MKKLNLKRWSLINKNTGNVRTSKETRNEARYAKRSSERIYDNSTGVFVR